MITPVPEIIVKRNTPPDPFERPIPARMAAYVLAGICVSVLALYAAVQVYVAVGIERDNLRRENADLAIRVGACQRIAEMISGTEYNELLRMDSVARHARGEQ